MAGTRFPYGIDEDLKILRYLLDNNFVDQVGGNAVWKQMEDKDVCRGRTWHSLKNRFKRTIRLDFGRPEYKLTTEERARLRGVAPNQMQVMGRQLNADQPKSPPKPRNYDARLIRYNMEKNITQRQQAASSSVLKGAPSCNGVRPLRITTTIISSSSEDESAATVSAVSHKKGSSVPSTSQCSQPEYRASPKKNKKHSIPSTSTEVNTSPPTATTSQTGAIPKVKISNVLSTSAKSIRTTPTAKASHSAIPKQKKNKSASTPNAEIPSSTKKKDVVATAREGPAKAADSGTKPKVDQSNSPAKQAKERKCCCNCHEESAKKKRPRETPRNVDAGMELMWSDEPDTEESEDNE